MATFLIADDHPLYRDAIRGALMGSFEQLTLLEAADLAKTVEMLHQNKHIDLLLLDLHMPGSGDLFGLIHIRKIFPDVPVAVLSGLEDDDIISKVLNVGAMGFVPKTTSAAQICQAVNIMLEGGLWLPEGYAVNEVELDTEIAELALKVASLTPAQYKVLCYMRDGLLNKQIAYNLDIATATVKAHVTGIFKKLHINNLTQAVLIASHLQLAPPVAGI